MSQLEAGVRDAVLERVNQRPEAREQLAEQLHMPAESVDRMLGQSRWELGLAAKLADQLGMRLQVISE
jgi:hypothetical protein